MLITHKDFITYVYDLAALMPVTEAYEKAEFEWKKWHEGRRKYKNYNSFAAATSSNRRR